MANLQKVIKVTQSQYNVLASGGRVGDYVGLDDNYIYLIEDTNTYITSDGGTIDGGDLTIDSVNLNVTEGSGVHIYDSNHVTVAAIGADELNGEIIYNDENYYRPLFANDDGLIIYSEDSDYNESIIINTCALTIADYTDTQNYITISSYNGKIYYYNEEDGSEYTYILPTNSGTLALTSDIINVVANPSTTTETLTGITIGNTSYAIQGGSNITIDTTTGSEYISDGTNTLNVVTRDTAQDITAIKTFTVDFKLANTKSILDANGNVMLQNDSGNNFVSVGKTLAPNSSNSKDLGASFRYWKDFYLAGSVNLKNSSASIGWTISESADDLFRINRDGNAKIIAGNSYVAPGSTNSQDLGNTNIKWKDLYLTGNITNGTRTVAVSNLAGLTDIKEQKLGWGPTAESAVGYVKPLGMAISNEHNANRLAFINGDALTMEYSSDGGSTWTNFNYSKSDKSSFCTLTKVVPVGRPDETTDLVANQSKTRITLTATDGTNQFVYTSPKKLLVQVCTATVLSMLVEYRTGDNYLSGGAWNTLGTFNVNGWTGWNDIPVNDMWNLGGSTSQTGNIWQMRLTFTCTTVSSSSPKTASIWSIRLFGDNIWYSTSNMAKTGHLYSYDINQKAIFPNDVLASNFIENGTLLSNKYQGKDADLTAIAGISDSSTGFLKKTAANTWSLATPANYYPTSFSWTNGTTAGPTGSLTGSGMSAVSFSAIPSASSTQSGIVTTGAQTFAGEKDFYGTVVLGDPSNNNGLLQFVDRPAGTRWNMGFNDDLFKIQDLGNNKLFAFDLAVKKLTAKANADTTSYDYELPSKSGTIALTSDLPQILDLRH